MRTVTRAFLRYLPRRRALSLLQVLGIAFGVASAVGMGLSGRAALSSFARAVAFVRGEATHGLRRPAGPLDEKLLLRLAGDPAVAAFSPVVDRRVALEGGDLVRVLGVDPFLDRPFRPGLAPSGDILLRFLTRPGAALVGEGLARRLGLRPGDRLPTARGDLEVLGTFPNPSGEPVVLVDIAAAQERFGLRGRVLLGLLLLLPPVPRAALAGPGWAQALVLRASAFPRDHGAHPEYRTEWWYFTGNLREGSGGRYGYQITFFRVGVVPEPLLPGNPWSVRDVYLAHLAVTDAGSGTFRYEEAAGRPGPGLAGASTGGARRVAPGLVRPDGAGGGPARGHGTGGGGRARAAAPKARGAPRRGGPEPQGAPAGRRVRCEGYVELTGYAGPLGDLF